MTIGDKGVTKHQVVHCSWQLCQWMNIFLETTAQYGKHANYNRPLYYYILYTFTRKGMKGVKHRTRVKSQWWCQNLSLKLERRMWHALCLKSCEI
ncbi:hypothetical protein VNO77_01762 [Canavalia gladiata]|uniref:Uncharacterized protein n=1 Tax=Canavalia gladiata TaxID=3824 RepID=A0AAN9MX02_CANGL